MLDGGFITALRTGAASGLATDRLARRDSRNLALFGCGAQGCTQVEAVCTVRDIERVWVFDISRERAEAFREEMSGKIKAEIVVTSDLSVLEEADIVCTATNATQPLFGREHIRPGTHINAVGSFKPHMQELDPELVQASRIYLDDPRACLQESGDMIKTVQRFGRLDNRIIGGIGDLVLGKIKGRTSPGDSTLFKSVGTAIQDLVVADRIFQKSRDLGFGEEIRFHE
jgi:ornithine cyclodeaminase/alanine dehydrogenase-like protein (mu-crystallin family)